MDGTLWRDFVLAFRRLGRTPATALMVALSLGLGVGLNAAVATCIDAVLLNPFPYRDSKQIVVLWGTQSFEVRRALPGHSLDELRQRSRVFSEIAAFQLNPIDVALDEAQTDLRQASYVSTDLLALLGTPPLIGRTFARGDDSTGDPNLIVLSHRVWKTRFGGSPQIVGTRIRVNRAFYTVLGVMPPTFFFPDYRTDIWLPLLSRSPMYEQVHGLARVRPGTTLDQARAELTAAISAGDTGTAQPSGPMVGVFSLHDVVVGQYALALWCLAGLVFVLLLLACANVSSLLLSRTVRLRRDFAIHSSLGASRSAIIRHVLFDALVQALGAAAIGSMFGYAIVRSISFLDLYAITGLANAVFDYRAALLAAALALACGVAAAVAPALRASRVTIRALLPDSPGNRGRTETSTRHLLVSLEVALCIVVVVSAGLLIHSFVRLASADWGFTSRQLFVAHLRVPERLWPVGQRSGLKTNEYGADRAPLRDFYDRVLGELQSLPTVVDVAVAYDLPLVRGGRAYRPLALEQQVQPAPWPVIEAVGPGYFKTLKIPLAEGREFAKADASTDKRVALVNQKLARLLWPGQSAVGKHVSILQMEDRRPDVRARLQRRDATLINDLAAYKRMDGSPLEVIGVVGDVRMLGLDHEPEPTLYTEIHRTQLFLGSNVVFAARFANDVDVIAAQMKDAIQRVADDATYLKFGVMDDLVGNAIGQRGTSKLLLLTSLAFGFVALALAAVGVYGVTSHLTADLMFEMAVRRAVGASSRQIVQTILVRCYRPVVFGSVLGLTAAFIVTRVLRGVLFGITTTDLATFGSVAALVLGTTLIACLLPSWKAARADTWSILRQ